MVMLNLVLINRVSSGGREIVFKLFWFAFSHVLLLSLTICQLLQNISHPYLVDEGVCGQFISSNCHFKIFTYPLFLLLSITFFALIILSLNYYIVFMIDHSFQISSYCHMLHAAIQVLF